MLSHDRERPRPDPARFSRRTGGKISGGCTSYGQRNHMHEDTDELDTGLADLAGVPLRDLPRVPSSVLDHALERLLRVEDQDQLAGFTNRI
jgi:FXSXX-COOH protein